MVARELSRTAMNNESWQRDLSDRFSLPSPVGLHSGLNPPCQISREIIALSSSG